MGERKEQKTRKPSPVEVQETGDIFFFYRPKVNLESAHSIEDIQRTYIVLRPTSGEKKIEEKQSKESGKEAKFNEQNQVKKGGGEFHSIKTEKQHTKEKEEGHETRKRIKSPGIDEQTEYKKLKVDPTEKKGDEESFGGHGTEKVDLSKKTLLRLIVMGRKSLPDRSKQSRPYWGFVELVSTDHDDVKQALASEEYETKTRGNRTRPGSRPLGEGVYQLIRHNKGHQMHTHLIYKLELPHPDKPHGPQDALNVDPEGSFIIQVKNPQHGAPLSAGLQNKRKARFPDHLQREIGSSRFVAADPPDLLNYEGCEFLLIGASNGADDDAGLGDLHTDAEGTKRECCDLLNLFGEFEREVKAPIVPLIKGEWA